MKVKRESDIEIRVRKRGRWTRVFVEQEGRDVSHLCYHARQVRLGPRALLGMAGIGGVGTEQEFQRRGLARAVLARALEEIRSDGYSCVGLYTSRRRVAHRLYPRAGFVDVAGSARAYKLLDPERFVCDALGEMVRGSSRLFERRLLVEIRLYPYEPVRVRLEEGMASLPPPGFREPEVSLRMSVSTFIGLWRGDIAFCEAEGRQLIEWAGDAGARRQLAGVFADWGRPVKEG